MSARDVLEYELASPRGVDRDGGFLRHVKILGTKSRNGVSYPISVMQAAIDRYEGATVFVDHPARRDATIERSVCDQAGWLQGCVVESDGLYGDLGIYRSHPLAEMVFEVAERNPSKLGLSHNSNISESLRGAETVCESINVVRSVDLVCKPATTRGIFESEVPAMDEMAPIPEASIGDVRGMIHQGIDKILDGDGEPAAKAAAIKKLVGELLKVEEKIDAALNGETAAPAEAPAMESHVPAESPDLMGALDVLESVGVTPSKIRLRAVAALESEADRRALAETWKMQPAESVPAKPRSQPVNRLESEKSASVWSDNKTAVARLLSKN